MTLLESDPLRQSQKLGRFFQTRAVRLADVMRDREYLSIRSNSRSDCKDKMALLTAYLVNVLNEPEYMVRRKLYRYYIQEHYTNPEELKKEYCPLIFKR